MKAVIFAGGLGTRLRQETTERPKPMVEIGPEPILWHIMKLYACHGIRDFVVCLGYKGHIIKDYFMNYLLHRADVTVDLPEQQVEVHRTPIEDWRVTLAETGLHTSTGGRLRRVRRYLDETFCLTYGDGLSDVDIGQTIRFHREQRRLATAVAVRSPQLVGPFELDALNQVRSVAAPLAEDEGWINGGFFVLEPEAIDYATDDATPWEQGPLQRLAAEEHLSVYRHEGFWRCMDDMGDKLALEALWESGEAPWKRW